MSAGVVDVPAVLSNIEKHLDFYMQKFDAPKEDFYLEMHPAIFWIAFNGHAKHDSIPKGEDLFGCRGEICSLFAYVKPYIKNDLVVLHHRPSRFFVSIRI